MDSLLDVMLEARRLTAPWDDDLRDELDGHIAELRAGRGDTRSMNILFLPTGPLQELSLDSGWGDEFVALADRFDLARCVHDGRAVHLCELCGAQAAKLTCAAGELRRETFTGVLTQRETPAVRAAIADAAALYALDPELAPFHCPECRRTYCGDHRQRH
ncbi:AN1-type zinc finger domain-containing protein [Solirubrobacter soli]|uniref:AN1-type zinc finger domain-containing protein n=1 Tax=Solirubrobacter soli TaxID=363832 RepID=UPI000484BD2E|nr:AN1-type zinc finger domain-containing protein [Solirubrobacter soli]